MGPIRNSITTQEDHSQYVPRLPMPLFNQFIEPTETIPDLARNVVYPSFIPQRAGYDSKYCRCDSQSGLHLDPQDFHLDQVTRFEEIVAYLTGHVIPSISSYANDYSVGNVGTRSEPCQSRWYPPRQASQSQGQGHLVAVIIIGSHCTSCCYCSSSQQVYLFVFPFLILHWI